MLDRDFVRFRDGRKIHFLIPCNEEFVIARKLLQLHFTKIQAIGLSSLFISS